MGIASIRPFAARPCLDRYRRVNTARFKFIGFADAGASHFAMASENGQMQRGTAAGIPEIQSIRRPGGRPRGP